MSLFHELRRRRAKVLFVCQSNSDLIQIAEALSSIQTDDVMEPCSAMATHIPNLAPFDVIVNLSQHAIQPGVYLLNANIDRMEQIVEFLASHFRWARDWQINAEDATQTTRVPPAVLRLQPVAATASL